MSKPMTTCKTCLNFALDYNPNRQRRNFSGTNYENYCKADVDISRRLKTDCTEEAEITRDYKLRLTVSTPTNQSQQTLKPQSNL